MKKILHIRDVEALTLGSSVYSTGGGIERDTQLHLFQELMKKQKNLSYISIDELSDDDYVCTAYAVGSAGDTSFDLSPLLKIGLGELEKVTNQKSKALFVGETNAEIIAFQAAASLNLPILDADSTGGRAVPGIQHDNFVIVGKSTLPLIAVSSDLSVTTIMKAKNAEEIEKKIRQLSQTGKKGLIAVLDHPIKVSDAKNLLTHGVLTRSIDLGKLIIEERKLSKIIEKIDAVVVIEGKVKKIQLQTRSGFLKGSVMITNRKDTVKVFVQNENIICWKNDNLFVTAPDHILLIDAHTKQGIHNSKIYEGQQVVVLAKKAPGMWRSKKGKKLFRPENFGFGFENKLL